MHRETCIFTKGTQKTLSSDFQNVQEWKNIQPPPTTTRKNPKALAKLPHCTGKAIKIDASTSAKKGNYPVWYLSVIKDSRGGQLGTIMKITINICHAAQKVSKACGRTARRQSSEYQILRLR
jgi:hypothetical protein